MKEGGLQIFQKASRTVARLGRADADSEEAFNTISEMIDLLSRRSQHEMKECRSRHSSPYSEVDDSEIHLEDPVERIRLSAALNCLTRKPWWQRAWVRQEVMANQNLLIRCGTYEDHFLHFAELVPEFSMPKHVNQLVSDYFRNPAAREKVSRLKRLHQEQALKNPDIARRLYCYQLFDLLRTGHYFHVSDHKDEILALVGMMQNVASSGPPSAHSGVQKVIPLFLPDYSKTLARIYEDILKYCINVQRSLACLEVLHTQPPSSDLASWVFDWRMDPDKYVSYWRIIEGHGPFNGCVDIHRKPPRSAAEAQDLEGAGELVMTGVVLGTISHLREQAPKLCDSYPSPFWQEAARMDGSAQDSRSYNSVGLTTVDGGQVYPFAGYWVSERSVQGDLVVLLRGGAMPFVLRRTEPQGKYSWVGPAAFWYYASHPFSFFATQLEEDREPPMDASSNYKASADVYRFTLSSFSTWLGKLRSLSATKGELREEFTKIDPLSECPSSDGFLAWLSRVPVEYRHRARELFPLHDGTMRIIDEPVVFGEPLREDRFVIV